MKDVYSMLNLMRELGSDSELKKNVLTLQVRKILSEEASYELVRVMRASFLVLGPLVARFGQAIVALPGGCAIGSRPIDLHIAGLQKMGATITLEHGYIKAEADRLHGADIHFEKNTVGGTENLVMAATLAEGETVLRNCAREPEIGCLCELLVKMGAKIDGIGEAVIRINGVDELGGADHEIIPDRIEAGTFMVAAALTQGDIVLLGIEPDPHADHHREAALFGRGHRDARPRLPSASWAARRSAPRTSPPRPSRASRPTCRPSSWSS